MILSILGGGATGCAVVISLLREIKKSPPKMPIQIRIFEKKTLGRGLAYEDFDSRFLLNTSAGITSIIHEDTLHFVNWLDNNKTIWQDKFPEVKEYSKDSFLSRALVGLYIESTLKKEIQESQVEVTQVSEWVKDIHYYQDSHTMKIITDKGKHMSDYCVLTTGYDKGVVFSYSHLLPSKNYYPSPYLYSKQIKQIGKDKKVLVLGTSLSAIDAAILLQDHSHVVMASRKGRLPAVRHRSTKENPKYLTEEEEEKLINGGVSLQSVQDAINKELSLAFGKDIDLRNETLDPDAIKQFKEDVASAKNHNILWEDSIFILACFITKFWKFLSVSDRKTLLKQNKQIVTRYISSFPYQNALILEKMLDSGSLFIEKGIHSVEHKNSHFEAIFIDQDQVKKESFDYVINATSMDAILKNPSCEIYKNLQHHGIVKENKFGAIKVGINLNVKSTYNYNHRFYAAGPITQGIFPFTNLLYTSAKQAKIIGEDLHKQLMANNEHSIFSRETGS